MADVTWTPCGTEPPLHPAWPWRLASASQFGPDPQAAGTRGGLAAGSCAGVWAGRPCHGQEVLPQFLPQLQETAGASVGITQGLSMKWF